MIYSLLTFLEHHYPKINIAQHFTSDAIKRNSSLIYDEQQQMIVDSTGLFSTYDEEEDEILNGFEVEVKTTETTTRPTEQTENDGMPGDNDSVSTLGTKQTNIPSMTKQSPARSLQSKQSSNTSVLSNTSAVTMESITSLQSQLEILNTRLSKQEADNQARFDKIIKLMSSKSVETESADNPHQGQNGADRGNSVGAVS